MAESAMIAAIRAWHAALNAGDVVGVAVHVSPDVVIVGPRGEATGRAVVEDWVRRAGIQLVPTGWYARADRVVVEEEAAWTDPATGVVSEPSIVATSFQVRDGLVTRIARFDTLGEALADAGLTEADGLDLEGTASL